MTHGWLRPDPIAATTDVILPVGGGLLVMIVLPALLFQMTQYIFPNVMVDDKFVCESKFHFFTALLSYYCFTD
jgi:E3 ubiquitin-protein ligase MARCH6